MIRVISDSSHGTFFTKCKRCRSGIAYDYTDVKFEDIPYSFVPKRTIVCPVCDSVTPAELLHKNDYNEDNIPLDIPVSLYFANALKNNCCCENKCGESKEEK